jgi:hypothetical protein
VKGSPKKLSSWETIGEIKEVGDDCWLLKANSHIQCCAHAMPCW